MISLGAYHQAIAHRGHRHFVDIDRLVPGQQTGAGFARCDASSRQHGPIGIMERDGVAGRHFGRYAIAEQTVDRVFGQQHTQKARAVVERNVQLQDSGGAGAGLTHGVDGLLQLTGQVVAVDGFARFQGVTFVP